MSILTEQDFLYKKVDAALETLRPHLQADGGDVELINIDDEGIAYVKLLGACSDCSMSAMTVKAGLEEAVRKAVPEITAVRPIE